MKTKIKNEVNEFKNFLKNYNVVSMAIGVVIGSAVKDLVTSIANNIFMPIVTFLTPTGDWQKGALGNLLSSLINFFIIALIVFIVIKKILKIDDSNKSP